MSSRIDHLDATDIAFRFMESMRDDRVFPTAPEETWQHAGLDCAVMGNPYGGLNGYVRVPEDHALHGTHYDDLPETLSVHRAMSSSVTGVTFAGALALLGDGWWLGWDTHHLGDENIDWPIERVRTETESLARQIAGAA